MRPGLPAAHHQPGRRAAGEDGRSWAAATSATSATTSRSTSSTSSFGQVRRAFVAEGAGGLQLLRAAGLPAGRGGHGRRRPHRRARSARWAPTPHGDTDGDGFSDGVEVHFRPLGADFNPARLRAARRRRRSTPAARPRCAAWTRTATGCSTATSRSSAPTPTLVDSDDDGVPDGIEWQLRHPGLEQDLDAGSGQRRARRTAPSCACTPTPWWWTPPPSGERLPLRAGGRRSGR